MIQPSLSEIQSGIYTPTLTNVTNVSASSQSTLYYMKVGDVVTFSGTLSITPTASGAITEIRVSIPILSNFSTGANAAGVVTNTSATVADATTGTVISDATNDEILLRFVSKNTVANTYSFTCQYRVM